MKKIIACIVLLALCLTAFVSCGVSKELTAAKDYLYAMYKDNAEVTASDYKCVNAVSVSGVTYTVEWSVKVTSGPEDGVKLVTDDVTMVTVDVDEKTEEEIVYVLTATIKDAAGKTIATSFNHKVPKFKESSWAEYAAATDSSTVVIKGVVTGIMAKSKGNSSNCLYLQDADGGYYVYNLGSDPVTEGNIEVGMTVRVTGTRTTYSGTYEIENGSVEILDSNKTAFTAVDFTDKFLAATSLKDASITAQQALYVTLKNVEITGEDVASGYYKFKLGSLESYIRISSSVCPITKDEQKTFTAEHASHLGWTANASGVICVYDGAFYLSPIDVNAFEYISLPEKDDAGMVAFEKENLTVISAATEDTTVTLPVSGNGYDKVSIAWASDNACAVVTDGKLVITLPDTDTTVKLTATITSGAATDTKEFEIKVDAAATDVYVAKTVDTPVKDTAYKFALNQAVLGKTLYFTGEMSGNYFATSDKAAKAVDVFVEEVEGGYRLYFIKNEVKTYIEIYEYTEGKVGVHLTAEPATVYTFNTEMKIFVANVAGNDYYLGTYNNYATMSASKTSYITGDNASKVGVSQHIAQLVTLAPAVVTADVVEAPVKDTAYKFALNQAVLGKTLYFTGEMSGNYFATSDKADKAVDVTVEEVEGGYRLFFMKDEVKTYIEIYEYAEGKVGVHLTAEPTTVYTFNTEMKIFIANVAGADYYLGTYNDKVTMSASKTSYITGDNASKVGVSQHISQLVTVGVAEIAVNPVTAPVKDTSYKFALNQAVLGKTLYFTGEMSGNYFATTDKLSKAVDVTVEEVEGGYRLYFMADGTKTYIEIYEYTEGKVGVHFTAEPTTVYTFNAEMNIFVANVAGNDYYLGTYNNYATMSASKTSYITGDNASKVGVSQHIAQLVTIDVVK